jgi:hypothetical protein
MSCIPFHSSVHAISLERKEWMGRFCWESELSHLVELPHNQRGRAPMGHKLGPFAYNHGLFKVSRQPVRRPQASMTAALGELRHQDCPSKDSSRDLRFDCLYDQTHSAL